ncbi:MAG TPA: response regulator transcription factor [Ohtaekwangia sp.]
MNNKTVLLADEIPLVRHGLRTIIGMFGVTNRILEASNGIQVLEQSRQNPVDLFILDFKMTGMNGYDVAAVLLRRNPRCKIIVLSLYNDTALITNLLQIGVRGFLQKNSTITEIESAIRSVLLGDLYFPALPENQPVKNDNLRMKFSPREQELILLLARGKTSKEIAGLWGLTQKSIETYRSRLLVKTGTRNSSELLHYVHRNGLMMEQDLYQLR